MRPYSKYSIVFLRITAVALFALAVSSCQTEPTKPVEDGTYSVSIPPINEEYRKPDLVTWKIGSDTGAKVVEGGGSSFQIKLQGKVEGDVRFDLWRSGVRIMQLKYARTTETTLEYVAKESEDSLARAVFQQILPSKDSIVFAKKLAELVVSSDSVNRAVEQAAAKIVGVSRDTLLAQALKIMAQSGKAIGAFVPQEGGTFLGHSLESIHTQVKVLVDLKIIVSDTNALFPPPPVRIVSNLSLPERLQAGGEAAGVNGKFEATGKIATLVAKVYQDTLDVSRHFEIPQVDLTSRPKELDLSGKLWLKARESAAAGTYRLEVVVMDSDEDPNSVKAVVGFQVLPAADTVGPIIQILSPTTGTVLENDVSTVAVKAQVEDPSGVDSVWIADKLAVGESGVWSVESVEIPVTDIGFAVVVRAKDAKGNASSKDVLVGRKAKLDPGSPTWSVLSPKANELFPFDSATASVLWKVSDPRAEIVKAWIGGGEASKELDGVWARRVELPATGSLTTVALLAVNANNDTIKGFVQVTRQADTKGPVIQIKSPVDGTVFAYDAQSVLVKVAATDPSGIDSLKIDSKSAESVGTEYAYSMPLQAGKETVIQVEAWDKLKNRSIESITVTRKGPPDTTAPRLKLLGPVSGTELSIDTKTATLRWLVTDLFGLADADVKIDGKVAQRSADTFSLEVAAPAPGKEESHRIDVKNTKGVSNFETMTLKRAKDVVAPKLVRVDSGRTVSFETEKATVSWMVSDNYQLGSVTIAGKVVTGVSGLYSQEVALATGDNRVAIVATDSANNSSTDTVIVHRTWKDTSKPLVVRQSGTESKNVPFATTEFTASWKVTDNALSTVTINGAVITSTDGIYSLKVTLTAAQTPITIVAKDAANNSKVDSITITKSNDLTDPVVGCLPGTKDTTVPYATSTYALGWEVIDDNGVASVSVNGVPAAKSGDNYQLTVSLPKVGLNEFLMTAKDVAGNESYDTIRIRRAYHDSIAPQRVRGANTKDTTVAYGTAKYTLSWTVTDNDMVKSVTIGGGVASVSQGVYSREVSLVAGANKFGMLATDTAGNTATDTVVITLVTDGVAPDLVITSPADGFEIPYPGTTVTVIAQATDLGSGLASISIDGKSPCTSSPCTITDVAPVQGKIVVTARDVAGNTEKKTIYITVGKDNTKPIIKWPTTSKQAVVVASSPSYNAEWTVTDNELSSVTINNESALSGANNTYSRSVQVIVDLQKITIEAKDKSGNFARDTIIARLVTAPKINPAGGVFTGSVQVTMSAAVGTVEYQIGSGAWMPYTTPVILSESGTLRARATFSGKSESSSAAVYTINKDVSLGVITINGSSLAIQDTMRIALPLFTNKAAVVAKTTDPSAMIKMYDGAASQMGEASYIYQAYGEKRATIEVSNGSATSKKYELIIAAEKSGSIKDRNGAISYKVVMIGDQWWMAENLKYSGTLSKPQGMCYDNAQENCEKYGRLYSRSELEYVGYDVCPNDFRVATSNDYQILGDAATNLALFARKDWGLGDWPNDNGTGYTLLPSGACQYDNGSFVCLGLGEASMLWTSSSGVNPDGSPSAVGMWFDKTDILLNWTRLPGNYPSEIYAGVRCIRK